MWNDRPNSYRTLQKLETMDAQAMPYNEMVCGILRRNYAHLKNAAKILARDARATPRAAANWLDGLNAPSGESLINLLANCEELAAEVNRLVAERRAERNGE